MVVRLFITGAFSLPLLLLTILGVSVDDGSANDECGKDRCDLGHRKLVQLPTRATGDGWVESYNDDWSRGSTAGILRISQIEFAVMRAGRFRYPVR